ncbi:hypothetical protein [Sulfitobacter geojensis]|jgi:hypothetical protein|uniref:Uncharacterized protein n=1 Tax=Sulfitobacter geojensis TaxID=1342299 RepID=A0AAE2VUK4_9RHOB|nr:hypothetical protein [Sulfitobacter geojensis]MBM1687645.1 hypothetical protein [Sulfitobacter geojensis]MBM1691712.1 hypothetical protein [Sulfitobacter geojensis]MBM1703878.1 hypothetical protein [Sulfitobacter geojensis]MBM1707936.1 hypothetical protein [Sulfitobacter geojensis]MBM1712001.1 hypothetical protein [Sulfitobacter geojensis]
MTSDEYGDEENYIDSLKVLLDMMKGNIALSGVPLALLLSQLRVLLANENLLISIVLTLAVVCLFVATSLSWATSQFGHSLLALDLYHKGDKLPKKGRLYLDFIRSLSSDHELLYSEKTFVNLVKKTVYPIVYLIVFGYLSLFFLFLLVIWQ